ncbi:SseB family protein [Microlunatus ginsengisoli]|uniref:SseB family protein n=1 Tax=Microlunatus ginsengisoli TaxID=363863 RepID=UPI0031CE2E88
MQHERTLSTSAFPGDTGDPDPRTRRLLAAFSAGPSTDGYLRVVAALCGDRVLVPVVATATRLDRGTGGLFSDKEAEMSVVGVQAPDGRRALLAFTGMDSLEAWDATARPVPVTLDKAAEATLADGAAALLVDLAGPDPLAIEGEVLAQLAAGNRLVELDDGFGWAVTTTDPTPAAE